jgi:Fe-Mn family superoxide dismutase
MSYSLPPLPYAQEALAPAISRQTIEYHYGKHTKAYFENVNRLSTDTNYEGMTLEQVVMHASGDLYNQAAQAWNHVFYFASFAPHGRNEPSGRLLHAIERDFESVDRLKQLMVEQGVKLFGSGWVWLSKDARGKLQVTQGMNANNPLRDHQKPLLCFDVWEHAYYLDYRNRRADALHALWNIVDWGVVEKRFEPSPSS